MFHRATILSGFDTIQADIGDSRLIIFLLEHWHRVFAGHAVWSSPSMFYPLEGTLGYTDMLFGAGVIYSVFRFFGAGLFEAANMMIVTLSVASYASAYWLLRRVLKLHLAACVVGALFFAFCYPKFVQLGHLQLRFDFFQPLALGIVAPLALEDRAFKPTEICLRLSKFVALLCLGASTTYYNAWFFGLFVIIAGLLAMANPPLRARLISRIREGWRVLWVPALLAGVLLIPFFKVYLPQMGLRHQDRNWQSAIEFIPTVTDYAWLGPEHAVWGHAAFQADRKPLQPIEKRLGVGVVGTILVIAAWMWAIRLALRSFRDRAVNISQHFLSVLLMASLVITLMTISWGGLYPWKIVYQFVPGASVILAVGRWALTLVLPISVAVALLADWLLSTAALKPFAGVAATALLGLLLCSEQIGRIAAVYSARAANRYHTEIAQKIPPSCEAFFLAPANSPSGINSQNFDAERYLKDNPDVAAVWPGTPWEHYKQFGEREGRRAFRRAGAGEGNDRLSEADFDAAQYLAANPDVARNWRGTAWEHYRQFGANEGRSPNGSGVWGHYENAHYQLSAMLASAISGKPCVNGASGLRPPGYELLNVFRRDRDRVLEGWLKNFPGRQACMVPIYLKPSDLTAPQK